MHTLEQLRAGELCGVRHLKLSENLTEFPTEILSLKETLEVLDLTGNQLSVLPDELAVFGKLRIIFCSENSFTELPEVLGRCPALTMVGFKANRIATVSAKSLPARLRWLILTDNAVQQLPDELGQCDALQKLMLSGNRLEPFEYSGCRACGGIYNSDYVSCGRLLNRYWLWLDLPNYGSLCGSAYQSG